MITKRTLMAFAAAWVLSWMDSAHAQKFPDRPVKIVLPFPAGTGPDIMMRLVSEKLKTYWNQAVIVENRSGANGWIATEFVKKSAPDGYTILQTDNLHFGLQPFVFKNFPFDAHKDFLPVASLYTTHYFVCVAVDSKWNTVADLVAAAKAANSANKALSYGSSGYASHMHLGGVMLESGSGVKMNHVPHKETPQVFVSVGSGDLDWAFGSPASTEAMYKGKKIKYLAISAPQRLGNFPDVPAVAETMGLANFELRAWVGMFAPAGTPQPIIEKLNEGVNRALQEPDVRARMQAVGATPWSVTPTQLGAAVKEDETIFGGVAKRENIRVE